MRRATRVFRGSAVDGRISIHALREESDLIIVPLSAMSGLFQSTLSVRRATQAAGEGFKEWIISIHALREESDTLDLTTQLVNTISIHALREESDFPI